MPTPTRCSPPLGAERLFQSRDHTVPEARHGLRAFEIARDEGEFVAAEPRGAGIRPGHGFQRLCDFDQKLVAFRMAVRVVDRLERVEVHQHHGMYVIAARGLGQSRVDIFHELAAVRQAGQGIVKCEVEGIALGGLAAADFPPLRSLLDGAENQKAHHDDRRQEQDFMEFQNVLAEAAAP